MNTTKLIWFYSIVVVLFISSFTSTSAQIGLSIADSLYFENMKDDTLKLREMTSRLGSRIASKARNRLGYLAFINKDYEKALSEFKVTKNGPDNFPERNESSFFLGRIAAIKNNHQEAINYLKEYLQKEKKGTWTEGAHYHLISSMVRENDPETSFEMQKYLRERPKTHYVKDVQYQLMRYFREKQDYNNAIVEAKKLVENYPESDYAEDVNYQIGDFYYKLGRVEEAKVHYRSLVNNNNSGTEPSAIGQYLLAEVYDKNGEYENARAEYKKVKERNPIIENWAILSDFSIAMSYYNEGLEIKNTNLANDQIGYSPDSAKINTAKDLFEEFVINYPTDKRTPKATMTLADIYRNNKQWEEALNAYNKIISFNAEAMTNISQDNRQKELEAHKELIEKVRFAKATLLKNELSSDNNIQILTEVVNEYDIILENNPQRTDALLGKAIALLDMWKTDEAVGILESLSTLNKPEGEAARYLLEQIKIKEGGN